MKAENPGPCPQKEQWGLTDDAIDLARSTIQHLNSLEEQKEVLEYVIFFCFCLFFLIFCFAAKGIFPKPVLLLITKALIVSIIGLFSKRKETKREIHNFNNDIVNAYINYVNCVNKWKESKAKFDKIEALRKKLALKSYWQTFIGRGRAFEIEFSELLKNLGFIEVILTQASNDGGVDIIAFTASYRIAVQCKAHSKPSGPAHVRELYGVVCGDGYKYGMLVNPSGFTKNAKEFAKGKNLYLVDLDGICKMAMRI